MTHRGKPFPADSILRMVTCWVPLTACGLDAPGLELVTRHLEKLLAPEELMHERVTTLFASAEFSRPVMEAGDALIFPGNILHRTHVGGHMMKDRTSVELRFFSADKIPTRLFGDRFLKVE
jgi:hypothetical protein